MENSRGRAHFASPGRRDLQQGDLEAIQTVPMVNCSGRGRPRSRQEKSYNRLGNKVERHMSDIDEIRRKMESLGDEELVSIVRGHDEAAL